ncbi:MAG: hypothetical protein H0V12_06645 [Chloroflexi bacterium]|nr:hypothetical protein [Chloroflexota bacterium]
MCAENGYWAFVPPPLPPDVQLALEIVRRLSAADRALGLLAGTARTLPNPQLLAPALLRREAVLSSRERRHPGVAGRSGHVRGRAAPGRQR